MFNSKTGANMKDRDRSTPSPQGLAPHRNMKALLPQIMRTTTVTVLLGVVSFGPVSVSAVSTPMRISQLQSHIEPNLSGFVEVEEFFSATANSSAELLTPTPLTAREAIFCDVCMRKPRNCESYSPDSRLFDEVRPAPEMNMGRLVECKPSEAEFWTTDGEFKIGDGYHADETRIGCPIPRRWPKYTGRLSKAQQICKLAVKKIDGRYKDGKACSGPLLKKFQSTNKRRQAHRNCHFRFHVPKDEEPVVVSEPDEVPEPEPENEIPSGPDLMSPEEPIESIPGLHISDLDEVEQDSKNTSARYSLTPSEPSHNFAKLSPREAIFCEVCMSKPSCGTYMPDPRLFDRNRPPPEQNLGRLVECKPSEAEYWTTDGTFKIGDGRHEEEVRHGCPEPRRRPKYTGRLTKAIQICNLATRSIGGRYGKVKTCNKILEKFQKTRVPKDRSCMYRFHE